jgi:hypothetical protein
MDLACCPCCHGKWFVLVICMAWFEGELTSLIEIGARFELPWFEGELVICLGFRGSMVFSF